MKPSIPTTVMIFSICILSICCAGPVHCFDDKQTHPKLTKKASTNSSLNRYLVDVLRFSEGLNTNLTPDDETIVQWLQTGSTEEDSPMCRASTHFHNPLLPWDQSYMTDAPLFIQMWCQDVPPAWPQFSNITWATGYTSRGGSYQDRDRQEMGWKDARTYFYQALTATTAVNRDSYLVKTFRALGQVMHLIEDMAVPAHVRNDFQSHLSFNGIKENSIINPLTWFGNPFEYYVKLNPSLVDSASPEIPVFNNPMLTDFWDTDQNGVVEGLAEFTNANYFSDETIPGNNYNFTDNYYLVHMFPQPNFTSGTYLCPDKLPGSTLDTIYVSRKPCPSTGGKVDHFVALSLMSKSTDKKYVLDDNVHNTYATEILPKAVGYASGLLDYFFRGTIELTIPNTANERFSNIRLKARNSTSSGEEMTTPEEIKLTVRYKLMKEDAAQGKLVKDGDEYQYLVVPVKNTVSAIPKDTSVDLEFDLSASPLPIWAYDVTVQVVFKGQIGNETGAIAVGMTRLPSAGGDIDLALPEKGIFGITTPTGAFSEFRIKATNVSAGNASMEDGNIELIVWYKRADQDPFQDQPTEKSPLDPEYYYIRVPEKNGVRSITAGTSTDLVFDLSQKPLPLWATDVRAYVVYTGQIGTEPSRMALGFRDIAEPTPVDIVNNMDRVCVNGSYLVAGSQEAIDAVGSDVSGRPNSDIYPHRLKDVYLSFSATPASSTNNSAIFPDIEPGQYGRAFVLTDYSFNVSSSVTVENINGPLQDVWGLGFLTSVDSVDGVLNQLLYENGEYIDYYPGMYVTRGLKSWWYTHYENPEWPAGTTCDSIAAPSLVGPVTVTIPE